MGLKTHGPISGRMATQKLSADITLTVEDSGKVFFLDTPGEAIIIPAANTAKGVHYHFIIDTTVASTSCTITSAGTNDLHVLAYGGGASEAAAGSAGTSVDVFTFTTSAEEGDFAWVISDGTKWHMQGGSIETAGLTEG